MFYCVEIQASHLSYLHDYLDFRQHLYFSGDYCHDYGRLLHAHGDDGVGRSGDGCVFPSI